MESRDSTRASRAADCEETIEAFILRFLMAVLTKNRP
jgi:hypothetical protein